MLSPLCFRRPFTNAVGNFACFPSNGYETFFLRITFFPAFKNAVAVVFQAAVYKRRWEFRLFQIRWERNFFPAHNFFSRFQKCCRRCVSGGHLETPLGISLVSYPMGTKLFSCA